MTIIRSSSSLTPGTKRYSSRPTVTISFQMNAVRSLLCVRSFPAFSQCHPGYDVIYYTYGVHQRYCHTHCDDRWKYQPHIRDICSVQGREVYDIFKEILFLKGVNRIPWIQNNWRRNTTYKTNDWRVLKLSSSRRTYGDVESFIGLISHYCRIVRNFAVIARSLMGLSKESNPKKRVFERSKKLFRKKPILRFYDSKAETELYSDACARRVRCNFTSKTIRRHMASN